jgi:hypothetical protein
MTAQKVNALNFVRAETDRMFTAIANDADGIGNWFINRKPTPLDHQPVIRQNRDTLYSVAIVDIGEGATLSVPDAGERYLSVMVVNQDHYINKVYHEAGKYPILIEEFDTPYVLLAARILVDPANPTDVSAVNRLQDQIRLTAGSNRPFAMPEYDEESFTATRNALLELARGIGAVKNAFGRKGQVDPISHLLATASGWGGLPDDEAQYINLDPGLPLGEYKIEVGMVPVDAFWSISLYNEEGYFEPNRRNLNSVNSLTAEKNADGTITVNFGVSDEQKPNYFPIMEGWNCLIRLYRPRPEVLDGRWTFPAIEPA